MNDTERIKIEKDKVGRSWGNINSERLKAILKFSGKKILDIGCSKGDYVKYLCKNSYNAYGIDLLFHTEWKGECSKCFSIGDVCKLPYKRNDFDTVLAFEVLEHIADVDIALQEIHRIVKNNIIISIPNCKLEYIFKRSGLCYYHWTDRTHVQTFTEDSIKIVLTRNKFVIKEIRYINPIYPEILFFDSLRIPFGIRTIVNLLLKNPLRKYRHMTILVVADKI